MRIISAVILSLLFLAIQLRYTLVQADYVVNKDWIVATLCINKERPEIGCAGKCHLKKQMAKVDVQEPLKENEGRTISVEELPLYHTTESVFAIGCIAEDNTQGITRDEAMPPPVWRPIYSPPPEV